MNFKSIAIFGVTAITAMLGLSMVMGQNPLMGIVFLAIATGLMFYVYKSRKASKPQEEPALYEKLTKAIEKGPKKKKSYGDFILTGVKPQKINNEGKTSAPEQAIQGKSNLGQVVKHQSIEVNIPIYNQEEGEKENSKETMLHAFSVKQKTGWFSSETYIIYVYNEELLRPVKPDQDIIVQAVDVFPFTEKHCITSTSPGRKMTTFVEDLGMMASAKSILNRLGKVTEETIKSNIEYQKNMRQSGSIIDYSKKGLKGAKNQYNNMTGNLQQQAQGGKKIDLPKGKRK